MEDPPGTQDADHGGLATAFSTATVGNATAFGFSITITGSFGVVQTVAGSPTVLEVLLFGVAAALVVGALEGAVTRGFRLRVGAAPAEVAMLGTAQDFVSVALGIGTAAGVASLVGGGVAWPAAGAAGTLVFLLAEATETYVAQLVQKRRGDAQAEEEGGEGA